MSVTPLFEPKVDDVTAAVTLLRAIARDARGVLATVFVHEGQPIAKARPRGTKAGVFYTPKHVVRAERDLAWVFKSHVPNRPWSGPIAIVALFFMKDQHRADGDNLLKLLLDSGTKAGIWYDDSQVTAHAVVMDLDPLRPRTVVGLAPAMSGLRRQPTTKARQGVRHAD